MNARSHQLTAMIILSALVACQNPKESKEPATTPVTAGGRSEGINAVPTGERGTYRINVGMEQIAKVRVVPEKSDGADGRLVDPSRWSFDRSTGKLHIDEPVDDAREIVVVLGTRVRPPEVMLAEGVDFGSVRVVVGDRLGVEGEDYTMDRDSGLLKLLGPDTPESPLRYYVQAMLRPDPAQPEIARAFAFGNRGDMETIRRLLGNESR